MVALSRLIASHTLGLHCAKEKLCVCAKFQKG